MSKISLAVETGNEEDGSDQVRLVNSAILKAIVLYLDTYPEILRHKVLAALESAQFARQKILPSKDP